MFDEKQYAKEYRSRPEVKERYEKQYQNNRDMIIERSKQWYQNHKEHRQDYLKQYYQDHAEQIKINMSKWHPINNAKRLKFKGKDIVLKQPPRIGVCNLCRAVKGIDCKQTQMHHVEYHDEDPLKDTIELCASCHKKEEWVLGTYTNRRGSK